MAMKSSNIVLVMAAASLLAACVQPEIQPAASSAANPVAVTVDSTSTSTNAPGEWQILRVDGDMETRVQQQPGITNQQQSAAYYSVGSVRISAALPEGFAAPTPPGAIELKRYASVRQALFDRRKQRGSAFFSLFRHIKDADIAMTAPVIMRGEMAGGDSDEASMAFLYRSTTQGETGLTERGVLVQDTAPMTVLSIGFQGRDNQRRLATLQLQLLDWLQAQPDDASGRWQRDGSFRLLGYNGPDTATANKWWEMQLPVVWQTDN